MELERIGSKSLIDWWRWDMPPIRGSLRRESEICAEIADRKIHVPYSEYGLEPPIIGIESLLPGMLYNFPLLTRLSMARSTSMMH